MSKKKNAEAKASKASKTKIPKQIAGVKIPKTLRDSGKAALKLAQNPVAREMLSAGLMAAATAVAANSRARAAAANGGRDAADAMNDAATKASDNAAKIGLALATAAGSAAQRFFGLNEDAPAKTEDAQPPEEPAAVPTPKPTQPRKGSAQAAARTAASAQAAAPDGPAASDEFPVPPNSGG